MRPAHEWGPWFRRRPKVAVVVAVTMAAGIFVLRLANANSEDAVAVLYVLPVALVALAFGFRVGLLAGLAGVGLVVGGTLIEGDTFSPLGWATRITPLVLLGTLVGIASDQQRAADERERHWSQVALLQREAAEINDGIVQGLAAAKWLLEAGKVDRGLSTVNETMLTSQALVARLLRAGGPPDADPFRAVRVGLAGHDGHDSHDGHDGHDREVDRRGAGDAARPDPA